MTAALASADSSQADGLTGAEEYARALLNVLEDSYLEKTRLKETQTAVFNVLGDNEVDRRDLRRMHNATLNILEDLHAEKTRLEAAQLELVRSGEAIRSSLREKEILLQEVHHRVKNNLQVISSLMNMQMRQSPDSSGRDALEQCQNRVLAMALIHEKLYQSKQYARVVFSDYATSLAANIFHTLGVSPTLVALQIHIDKIALTLDKAIPCGLILNELITNALRHAFPDERRGIVRVELHPSGERELALTVSDDGVGLPDGFDPAKCKSLGIQLVSMLVEQLDGRLEIVRGRGTTIRIQFPVEEST